MSAVAVFAAFVVGRIIIDNVEELILRERETIARCVSRLTAGPQGPQLDLATALRDVADVNRAFANPALGVSPRPGWRYRATLVYKPGLGQEAFFRALRLGPRLAAMMGTVCVDVEEARAASHASTVVEDASHGNEEASDVTAFGVGSAVEGSSDRTVANDRTGEVAEPERDDGLDDEGYDFVGGPCRRATLAEFYTLIRPAMHRIGVDTTPAAARAARAARAPRPSAIASDADTRMDDAADDDSVCAICMDGTLEVVTRCGHAYCEECYLRWLAVSRECPLCRQRLGRYDAYALVGEEELEERGDGDVPGDAGGDAGHGAEWLVGRLAALPPVAEEADGRRARVANLLQRLRERQAGKEVADQGDGTGTRVAR